MGYEVTNGTINYPSNDAELDQIVACFTYGEGCEQLITDLVFVISGGEVTVSSGDFENLSQVSDCLMGSNSSNCDVIQDYVISVVMNATEILAQQCEDFAVVYNCVMYQEGCGKLINDVVFFVSNGSIGLDLTEPIIDEMRDMYEDIVKCSTEGYNCEQVLIDIVYKLSSGKINYPSNDAELDQIVGCFTYGEECEQLITDLVFVISSGEVTVSSEDFEKLSQVSDCLMGSNSSNCDVIQDYVISVVMNATEILAQQCADFAVVYNCVMYQEGCGKLINDVVFFVSNGSIGLHLTDEDIIDEMNDWIRGYDCIQNGNRC